MTRTHHIPSRLKPLFTSFVALLLFGLVACKKDTPNNPHDPNTLPPLTHEGKNTFGCLVNGEVWVAYAPFTVGGTIALEGGYHMDVGSMHIRANRKNNDLNHNESIDIRVKDLFSTGFYQMYGNHNVSKGLIDYSGNFNCSTYYIDTNLLRQVDITYFSLGQGVVSGTFEMDLVNPSCSGDTLRIREGRFDWRMTVY